MARGDYHEDESHHSHSTLEYVQPALFSMQSQLADKIRIQFDANPPSSWLDAGCDFIANNASADSSSR